MLVIALFAFWMQGTQYQESRIAKKEEKKEEKAHPINKESIEVSVNNQVGLKSAKDNENKLIKY